MAENSPGMPIRDIPMGLVQVYGKATGEQHVSSPITGTPCFFYKIEIEKWEVSHRSGHWSHYCTDTDGVPFYLADGTGKVVVDAHAAELDLPKAGKGEIGGPGVASAPTGLASNIPTGAPEEDLPRGVSPVGVNRNGSPAGVGSAALGPLSDPAKEKNEQAVVEKFLQRMESMERAQQGGLSANPHAASVRYRFTEYCLVPDRTYEVTGTCVENPTPKDEHDRKMIARSESEPTFLISYRTEKQGQSNLWHRAALYGFGGLGLSIACLVLLLF